MGHEPKLAHAAIVAAMIHLAFPGMAQGNAPRRDPPPPPVAVPDKPAPRPPAPAPTPPLPGPRTVSPQNVSELAARILETYPAQAKREGREGVVGVRVDVSPEGRAIACTVTQSSGHADLDEAACRGMQRFARFNPARGSDGRPKAATYSTRITYRAN